MSAIEQQVIGRAACLHEMIQTCWREEAKTAGAVHFTHECVVIKR